MASGTASLGASSYAKSQVKNRRITQDMLLASTSMTRDRNDSLDQYFERVTHLHLQAKRLTKIEGLEKCKNIKVLYLYDNQIDLIEGLDHTKQLSYLYLQNNLISSIPRLNMVNLRKLFLDDNEIFSIGGLESCGQLEELYVARQRLPKLQALRFEKATLDAVAQTLRVLEVSGNNLTNIRQFSSLSRLRVFKCVDNELHEIGDIRSIVSLPDLIEASFARNPCTTSKRYRDYVVGWSTDSLKVLDDVQIQRHQQHAIKRLQLHRQRLGNDILSTNTSSHRQQHDDDASFPSLTGEEEEAAFRQLEQSMGEVEGLGDIDDLGEDSDSVSSVGSSSTSSVAKRGSSRK